jgi:hypothetical protein
MDKKQTKITSEKPVSLSPLGFKDALTALLKGKPKPKKEKSEQGKKEENVKPSDLAGLLIS